MIKCLLAKLKSFFSRFWGFYCQHYILLAVIASIIIFAFALSLVSCRGLQAVGWHVQQSGNTVSVTDNHGDIDKSCDVNVYPVEG